MSSSDESPVGESEEPEFEAVVVVVAAIEVVSAAVGFGTIETTSVVSDGGKVRRGAMVVDVVVGTVGCSVTV